MQKAKGCHKMTRPRSKQLSSRKCWLPTAEATFRRRPHHRQRPGLPLSHPPWPQPALHHPAGPYLAETRPAKDPRDSTSTRPGPSAPPPRRRPHSLWRSASGLPPPPPQVPGHPGSGSRLPGVVGAPAGRGLPPPAPPPPQSREEPAADADGMHPRPIEARKRILSATVILVSQLLPYSPYNARQSDYLLFQSCCSMGRFSGIEN